MHLEVDDNDYVDDNVGGEVMTNLSPSISLGHISASSSWEVAKPRSLLSVTTLVSIIISWYDIAMFVNIVVTTICCQCCCHLSGSVQRDIASALQRFPPTNPTVPENISISSGTLDSKATPTLPKNVEYLIGARKIRYVHYQNLALHKLLGFFWMGAILITYV